MEYENFEWTDLTPGQCEAALQFVPPVFDQSLGDAFVSCVRADEKKNEGFNLKVGLGGG